MAEHQQKQQRIEDISEKLRQYEHEYYVLGKPSVSDSEYDRLFNELLGIEKEKPNLILPDSPSQRVGSDLDNDFPEHAHSIPVLSLDKAYTLSDITAWIRRCSKGMEEAFHLVIEEKIDGSSLALYYEDGVLNRALTRGNGKFGNDITNNIKTIHSIPLRLEKPIHAAIRGEVYIKRSDFENIKSKTTIDYANPRNFASGSLRRINSAEVAKIPLCFFAYEPFGESFNSSHSENMDQLLALKFSVNSHQKRVRIDPDNDELLRASLKEIEEFLTKNIQGRAELDYEIDGMVIKIDEIAIRERLGYTGHHPRWAIAYKFESPQGITSVQNIDVQVGRTGRITPVARVQAVFVGGTSIRNITLHNQAYIDGLGLSVGDTVAVSRRGDVIPAIEQVLEKGDKSLWQMPRTCPSCSENLEKVGAHHFCKNFDCPDRTRGRIIFFTGRDQMDIENFGAETVITLMNEGIIRDIPDIFRLDYDKIATLPGFAEKKVQLIQKGVEKARRQSYRRIMVSLGISDFGPKLAELLEEHDYTDIDALFTLMDEGRESTLADDIKGVGTKTVQSISEEMKNPRFRQMIRELKSLGLVFRAEAEKAEKEEATQSLAQIFAGQSWCITGSFDHFVQRSRAIEEIKKRGGRSVSAISNKTTHLLAGSSAGGKKLTQAGELGISIVSESAFLALLKKSE